MLNKFISIQMPWNLTQVEHKQNKAMYKFACPFFPLLSNASTEKVALKLLFVSVLVCTCALPVKFSHGQFLANGG